MLVVEDDQEIRETLRDILQDEGYDVGVAENGRAALAWLAEGGRPDLIVLDLMMPEMSGLEFRERQLARQEWARIPVVVISAAPPSGALAVDEARFLRKPFSLEAILNAVDTLSRDGAAVMDG